MEKKELSFGKSKPNRQKRRHIPSKIQADTLFTFTTELNFLMSTLKNQMISPRYCEEDISYLRIPKIKNVAYPMKCFCDINLHRLSVHLEWYGYYGLAFSKEWGMKKGIQPIQYINPESALREDFSAAFISALNFNIAKETNTQLKLKSFLLHEMMYYKPYEGKIKNRNTGKFENKCFTDECEWRFIPDVTKAGFVQVYYNKNILNVGILSDISNSMEGIESISLKYEYTDIKYIIVKTRADFKLLAREIVSWGLDDNVKYQLISKIITWDDSQEDF